jgi:hypothetical protein
VNKIRDFSSGILKQLANVSAMERNIGQSRLKPSGMGRVYG